MERRGKKIALQDGKVTANRKQSPGEESSLQTGMLSFSFANSRVVRILVPV